VLGDQTAAPSAGTTFTTWSATGNLTLGRDRSGGSAGDYLPGEISDVRVFDRAVTSNGVQEIANDSSTDTVTTANAVSWLRKLRDRRAQSAGRDRRGGR
jgi:hypothetical protein